MAGAGNHDDTCELHISGTWRYTLPTSATVMEVKQEIVSELGIEVGRLSLNVQLPHELTKMENHRTLADYGIMPGETKALSLVVAKITVLARFIYYDLGYPIDCYELWDTVRDLKMLIVGELRKTGLRDIGADDMDLYLNNGAMLDNLEARLSQYGVHSASFILVKTSKDIALLRRRNTSAL